MRRRKRKNAEVHRIIAHPTTGIPDLNVARTAPGSVLPQVEPTKRRRCEKEEKSSNGFPRGIVVLVMKFSSQVSTPSRDDLTSMFSAFGPLEPSETHVSEELSSAQVAFVSSGGAIKALKSLMKATNPFGETLLNYRVKVISAPGTAPPVIRNIGSVPTPDKKPTSVNSMNEVLEKSGDQVSEETKAELKSDITALLEKVNLMSSSSSSSS